MTIHVPHASDADSPALTPVTGIGTVSATGESMPQANWGFWKLLSISIGFLGIQFAWAIQMGQMSPLLERLGSADWLTPLLWCAGPVTGIVVQPIVGSWSDRTWTRLGRRRPFLLAGALLTAIALVIMPNTPSLPPSIALVTAAALLWVLDASINISQGPYRAMVPDVVPRERQAFTYSLMSFTIGLGSVAAFYIGSKIPSMHNLFYLGAIAMLVAMGWTIFTTKEPPRPQAVATHSDESGGFKAFIAQTVRSIASMSPEMKKLCLMHSFTWFGLQFLFIYFALYIPHHIFGATDPTQNAYIEGVKHASLCYAALNAMCFIVSPFIGKLCDMVGKKPVHTFGLMCLGGGLISMPFLHTPLEAMIAMAVMGIGWATTLSVPFALLASHVPPGKEGVLMGTFNIFIAAPQFVASILIASLKALAIQHFAVGSIIAVVASQINNDASALVLGGGAVLISALLLQGVKE